MTFNELYIYGKYYLYNLPGIWFLQCKNQCIPISDFYKTKLPEKNKHFNRQLVNSFEENNVFTNVIHVYVWYLF